MGTQNKYIYRIDNANVGDPSVVKLPNILTGMNSYCYDIAINPDNAEEIIVVYSNYSVYSLFHSLDGGQNWTKIAGNLEQNASGSGNGPSCRTAEIIPLANDTLYLVGTSVGLFGTSKLDGENTIWKQIASNTIGSVVVEYLTYRQNDGLLVVATHGNGIYQTNINSANDILSSTNDFHDKLNINLYPNPTSENINITFNLQKSCLYNMLIFNENGKLLFKKEKISANFGKNIQEVNLNSYRSGIYFVSLELDGGIYTKQIIKK